MSSPQFTALTASEIGYLWTGYTINEMSTWFLDVFHHHASDPDIKELYIYTLQINHEIVCKRKELLSSNGFPIPTGFATSDSNKAAPALYSDQFLLHYLQVGALLGLEFHSKALASGARSDVRSYFEECMNASVQLSQRVMDLLLSKGMYWRPPTLPIPAAQEKMQKPSYLNGWLGDTRPLNSMEIANLYASLRILSFTETLSMGFAQIAETQAVKELLLEGSSSAKQQFRELAQLLDKDSLPSPPTYIGEITDTKQKLFSDRIMVSHIAGVYGSILTQYGYSLGSVMKHDLLSSYTALIGKAGTFSEKLTKFMINQEWLEKVPGAVDRQALVFG
ncbi:DUF3231 family protein [Paenibacillus hexagrammi]|uniref:DUF3231 family protein n=1 Tax=Paenibacillus hexagrammi TaxID=2908839 RepID=A0ABY3SH56_9BACL|nr:DUF3231 family protein [Paenibacillus sp. YPD9-1]UJF32529.1 DUF3231 family protein [Paenibacillus sp. YPD9-1]